MTATAAVLRRRGFYDDVYEAALGAAFAALDAAPGGPGRTLRLEGAHFLEPPALERALEDAAREAGVACVPLGHVDVRDWTPDPEDVDRLSAILAAGAAAGCAPGALSLQDVALNGSPAALGALLRLLAAVPSIVTLSVRQRAHEDLALGYGPAAALVGAMLARPPPTFPGLVPLIIDRMDASVDRLPLWPDAPPFQSLRVGRDDYLVLRDSDAGGRIWLRFAGPREQRSAATAAAFSRQAANFVVDASDPADELTLYEAYELARTAADIASVVLTAPEEAGREETTVRVLARHAGGPGRLELELIMTTLVLFSPLVEDLTVASLSDGSIALTARRRDGLALGLALPPDQPQLRLTLLRHAADWARELWPDYDPATAVPRAVLRVIGARPSVPGEETPAVFYALIQGGATFDEVELHGALAHDAPTTAALLAPSLVTGALQRVTLYDVPADEAAALAALLPPAARALTVEASVVADPATGAPRVVTAPKDVTLRSLARARQREFAGLPPPGPQPYTRPALYFP